MPVAPNIEVDPIMVPGATCVECVAEDGHHYVTTEELCKIANGRPLGKPFPCEDGAAVTQRIKDDGLDQPKPAIAS